MLDTAIPTHASSYYLDLASFFRTHDLFMYPLNTLVMAFSIILASYHVGVEQGIFQGPQSCSSSNLSSVSEKVLKHY